MVLNTVCASLAILAKAAVYFTFGQLGAQVRDMKHTYFCRMQNKLGLAFLFCENVREVCCLKYFGCVIWGFAFRLGI